MCGSWSAQASSTGVSNKSDAFREIPHDPGQLAGAEQDQDDGQNDQPVHQTHRTHVDTPETETVDILTEAPVS